MKLPVYLNMLEQAEQSLGESFRTVADGHGEEPDVHSLCQMLASQCDEHQAALHPIVERYGDTTGAPERLHSPPITETRSGPVGLLRDLQELYLLAHQVDITWTMIKQAGQGLRDKELLDVVSTCDGESKTQMQWLQTRLKTTAPQALLVAD